MRDLSLHILDLAMNSIRAKATLIEIEIIEQIQENLLLIQLTDNGCGMTEQTLDQVKNPFFTTRTTRKVGLGLSLLTAMANRCQGDISIDSKLGEGTNVIIKLELNHIDRPPFGDIHNTLLSLIYLEPQLDFSYIHRNDFDEYYFETSVIRQIIGEISLTNPDVITWMKNELEIGDFKFTSY